MASVPHKGVRLEVEEMLQVIVDGGYSFADSGEESYRLILVELICDSHTRFLEQPGIVDRVGTGIVGAKPFPTLISMIEGRDLPAGFARVEKT